MVMISKTEDTLSPCNTKTQPPFYASSSFVVEAWNANSVCVSLRSEPATLELIRAVLGQVEAPALLPSAKAKADPQAAKAVRAVLERAVADVFRRSFATEIGLVVDAYRVMLRESLAKGEDPELLAALNRARIQEKILAGTSMVDQAHACQLLGLSDANPSATMKRKEDKKELLRFTIDGRAVYPLFQFDVEGRRLFPAMARLLARRPPSWSDFRLLHWLTRPHLDFDGTPAEALKRDEAAVVAAFDQEIEPPVHG